MSDIPALPPGTLPSSRIAALATIAAAVSQSLSLDETLRVALSEVLRVMNARAGGISLVDETGSELVLRAQQGWAHDFVRGNPMRIPVGVGMSGEVLRNNAPLINTHLTGREPLAVPAFHDEHFQSIILAPIHARGRVTGILSIMSSEAGAFAEADVELLCSVADTIGIALENARLYEESVSAQRRLNAVLRASADGILATDVTGRIQVVNPAAERLLGIPASVLLQQPLSSAPLPQRLRLLVLSATQTGGVNRSRALRVTLDERRILSAVVLPVLADPADGSSLYGGWLVLLQDITHLAEAERARSAFLHAAAHDMRNPLSATIQSLTLVRRMVLTTTPALEEMLDIAQAGLSHIDRLIDELLALEKIQN